MATKDWKLIKREKGLTHWMNKKNNTSLFVYKQDYASGKKDEWFVEHSTSKGTLWESNPKKKKSQALRIAKIYMKSN